MKKPDLSKNPYRGILSEIARRRKVTKQAVHKAYHNNNRVIVMMVNNRVASIDRQMGVGQ